MPSIFKQLATTLVCGFMRDDDGRIQPYHISHALGLCLELERSPTRLFAICTSADCMVGHFNCGVSWTYLLGLVCMLG